MKKRLAILASLLVLLVSATTSIAQSAAPASNVIVQRRAVEAVIWGMPAVNYQLMLEAFQRRSGAANEVVYWSRPSNWQNQTLTPNPDTIYFMPFYDTKDGPIVLEVPPANSGSVVGSIDDAWQDALEDVGPAGADKGMGGKYLILPPGYADAVPSGYIVLRSETFGGFALIRSSLKGRIVADITAAVAYAKRMRLYPLSEAANPPATTFVDAYGTLFDSAIPYDLRYFQALNRFIQNEPWLTRDKVMIGQLASLGIEKGKLFKPTARTQSLLTAAANEAQSEIEANYESGFAPPFYPATHWALPVMQDLVVGLSTFFEKPDS